MSSYDDALPVTTIYAAENNVMEAVQRGGTADFFSSTLDLNHCRLRTYKPFQLPLIQGMTVSIYMTYRNQGARQQPPTVRVSHRSHRQAWYSTNMHQIVLPASKWAWNDLVICHELAHACSATGHDQRSAHGHAWRKTYAAIVAEVIGPEAALLLQAALDL